MARETAEKWCADNSEWEFTGEWRNTRKDGVDGETSEFQVRKKVASAGRDATTAAETETTASQKK